jgi:hypothetical protein
MKNFEFKKFEPNFPALLEEIKKAELDSRPVEEADKEDLEEARAMRDFLNDKINLKEYLQICPNRRALRLGEVYVPGYGSLNKALLYLLKDKKLADEITEHEKSHLEEALRLGFADSKLMLRFFRENEEISFRASMRLMIPEEGDEEEIRKRLRIIIEAPQILSDLDTLSTEEF